MTWPDGIAAVLGTTALALILIDQHRSTTQPHHHTRRTEPSHGHQHQRPEDHPG